MSLRPMPPPPRRDTDEVPVPEYSWTRDRLIQMIAALIVINVVVWCLLWWRWE